MKREEIIDIIANNALNAEIRQHTAIRFLTSGGIVKTQTIPQLSDFKPNYVILRDVEYRFSAPNESVSLSIIALEYDKIIGATHY